MLGQTSCPTDPPMPAGYKLLSQGAVTPAMQQWAYSIVHDPSSTYGNTFDQSFGGLDITARVEHHPWTTGSGGQIVYGCYKGVTLYQSPPGIQNTSLVASPAPSNGVGLKAIEALLIGGALFGTAFTVAKAYFENKQQREEEEGIVRQQIREQLQKRGRRSNPYVKPRGPVPGAISIPWYRSAWPVFEAKIIRRGSRHDFSVLTLERHSDGTRNSGSAGPYRNRNEALYEAGKIVNEYVQRFPANTNPSRVLDELGRCIYAAQGVDTDGEALEVEC